MKNKQTNKQTNKQRAGARASAGAPYLSVDDLVSAERARLPEALPAHLTHERPRARVHGHVAGQVVVRVEHLRRRSEKTG